MFNSIPAFYLSSSVAFPRTDNPKCLKTLSPGRQIKPAEKAEAQQDGTYTDAEESIRNADSPLGSARMGSYAAVTQDLNILMT